MKVLIVDDEKLLVKGMKFNFEQDGYTVETAYDGEEALKLKQSADSLKKIVDTINSIKSN